MKYRQLTKEQFEILHKEFAHFLASQQIDVNEWQQLKKEKPQVAEEELNVFSDIVWDDVLTKTKYIEHYSEKIINLFRCENQRIYRIVINVDEKEIDLTQDSGVKWLFNDYLDDCVEILKGEKKYTKDRNIDLFELIEKGGVISEGELYMFFETKI